MNKNVFSQLAAEFEKMEKTIEFQSKIIKAATAYKSTCPCGFDQSAFELPKLKLDDCSWAEIAMYAPVSYTHLTISQLPFSAGPEEKAPPGP